MATKWTSPVWRMPENSNQSKLDNYSLDFDTTDAIVPANNSSVNLTSHTVSAWIRPNSESGGIVKIHCNQRLWYVNVIAGGIRYTIASSLDSTTAVSTTEFTHVVVSIDQSVSPAVWKIYQNGVQTATKTGNVNIGSWGGGSNKIGNSFDGEISQCAIFDYALSETQVKYLYNNNAGGSTPNPQNPMAIAGPTPVAYYPLGQSATGDNNTLTTPNESGSGDTVFDFNSSDSDYINLNPSIVKDFATDNFSISAWIKADSFVGNYNQIYSDGATSNNRALGLVYASVRSGLEFSYGNVTTYRTSPNISLDAGKWYHVVATYDQTGATGAKIYINGNTTPSATNSNVIALDRASHSKTAIGAWTLSGASSFWNGQMSNVQIWNGVITPSEVATLYNGGIPYTGTQPQAANLKGWWKMNVDTSEWNGSNWLLSDSSITPTYTTAINFPNTFQNPPALWPGFTRSDASWSGTNITLSFWVRYPNGYDGSVNYIRASGINIGGIGSAVLQFGSGSTYRNFSVGDLYDKGWHNVIVYIPNSSPTFLISNVRCWIDGSEVAGSNIGFGTASQITTISGWGLNSASSNLSNWTLFNSDLTGSISTLYNGGTPADVSSLNPVSWYKCDSSNVTFPSSGGTSITFIDSSSSSNNATGPYDGNGDVERPSITNTNVQAGNGTSSGMTTANLVTSDLNRSLLYSSYSMVFDGASEDIRCGNSLGSSLAQAEYVTVSCWVYFNNITEEQGLWNFRSGDNTNDIGTSLSLYGSGTVLRFAYYEGGNNGYVSISNPGFSNENWYNIICVYDKGAAGKIYINGQAQTVVDSGVYSTVDFSSDNFYIGSYYSSTYSTNGNLSNIAVWNSELTSDQVLTVYNGGAPNDISSLSPIRWWSLSGDSYFDGSNFICPNLTSSSNDGTSYNLTSTDLVGNAPGSTSNGTGTSMNIPGNLEGNAPNSDKNAYSVNMVPTNRDTSVPSIP